MGVGGWVLRPGLDLYKDCHLGNLCESLMIVNLGESPPISEPQIPHL